MHFKMKDKPYKDDVEKKKKNPTAEVDMNDTDYRHGEGCACSCCHSSIIYSVSIGRVRKRLNDQRRSGRRKRGRSVMCAESETNNQQRL